MELKLDHLLPENWLHALGAMLFHSLWLGVLLAIVAGVVMFATRKSSARLRYNLLTSCLLLFVLVISVCFYLELKEQVGEPRADFASEIEADMVSLQAGEPIISGGQSNISMSITKIMHFWNAYSYHIVLAWFLVICFKSIQLLFGLNQVYQLRKKQLYKAGNKWDDYLNRLAERLALTQPVKLMQSGIAKVPMVVGHFKPLILIPLGLLNGLDTAEVEAILAHELAHIKRRDYLVNLLQSLIEIVFFFNPAVLWVSQLIKTEREHCCDDLAIACVNDRKNYVKALIFCQEYKQRAPAYAMGIMGQKSSLLHRVSRMLFNTNSTLNKMEKTILTIALVSTVICTIAFKSVGHAKTTVEKKEISSFYQFTQDTANSKASNVKSADQLEKEIDQKIKAAEKKTADARSLRLGTKSSKQILSGADDKHAKEDSLMAINDAKQARIDAAQAKLDATQAEMDGKQAAKDAIQAKLDAKQAAIDAKQAKIDAEVAQNDAKWSLRLSQGDKIPKAPKPPRAPKPFKSAIPAPPAPPVAPFKSVAPPPPPTPPSYNDNASGIRNTRTEKTARSETKTIRNGNDYTDEINKELIKDQIISNTNNLSYTKLN